MVTVLVVVLPYHAGTAPFWAGEACAIQHKGTDDGPRHGTDVVSVKSVVVVVVSTGVVVVVAVAP